MIVDSHCHLNMKEFQNDLDDVIARARGNGITHMQTICTKLDDLPDILAIAEKYPNIFASVGVHPHDGDDTEDLKAETLIKLSKHPKIIGLGETGLDYYYEHSNRINQKNAFITHINAAQETELPVIIHTREADIDTIDIIQSEIKNKPFPALIHCFSSTEELAFKCLDLGMYISISGIITFKNTDALRATVRKIPLDRLLVETDAPYLAPIPMRGKRNEPSFTRYVAEKIAEIKGVMPEEIFAQTTNNFFKLFTKAKYD